MSTNFVLFYLIGGFSTFLMGGLIYVLSRSRAREITRWFLWILIAGSGYIFFAQYFKYASMHFYVDFSHWLQILEHIAKIWKPEILSHEIIRNGTLNYFSVHFVPFVYLFAIFFKIFPHPGTLIVLNGVLMLSSAIPLYLLARRFGNKVFGLFLVTLLFWYPTFQYITLYEFEMLRFSIPILLWMLYFFETRRMILYLLFVVLAILVREEMGLTVAMFGIYAWFVAKRRREGILAVVLGLLGFAVITSVIMPALRGGEYTHVAVGVFSQFGSTPLEILRGVLYHPLLAAQNIFNPVKLANLFMLGLPLLFLPLAAVPALFGAAANIGTGLLSEAVVHTSYMLYYIAPSVPFIFYAFLKAWPKLVHVIASPEGAWRSPGMRLLRGVNPDRSVGARNDNPQGALMNTLLAAVLVSNIFFGPSPISLQFWIKDIRPAPFRTQDFHFSAYRVTGHHRNADKFVRLIPDEAIVSAPQFLHPRLYKKRGAMVFPDLQSKDGKWQAQYVLLDTTNNGLKPESPAFISAEAMATVRESPEWESLDKEDGYELYFRIN